MSSETSSRNPLLVEELFYAILHCLVDTTPEPPPNGVDVPYRVGTNGILFRAPDPDTRRALASLARTCRAFTCPALDFLWRRLSSLEPLLWCFTPREAVLSTRQPLRPPSLVDWDVIKRYACRIQYLEVHDAFSSFFLGCVSFETNLFPNLKALKWNTQPNITPLDIKLIQPFFGPTLVVLDVTACGHDLALPSLLKVLPSRCPAVTTARFNFIGGETLALTEVFSRAICSFTNLESLIVDAFINNCVLQDVARSTKLQELCLGLQFRQPQNLSRPFSEVSFRNLKRLVLRLLDLRQLIELLRPGHQHFCEIMLRLLRVEFATLIGSLFAGLAMHPRTSTLSMLHLRSTRPHLDLLHIKQLLFMLSYDTFRPLTCHIHLRELVIKLPNPISLNDEELVDLVRNWPLLQVLELCYFFPLPIGAKYMTFNGLLSLMPVCPELRHVGLTLDGTELPDEAAMGSASKTIMALRFYNSPINNQARRVADFLLTHFPSVTSVTGPPGAIQVDRHGREWAEVEAYMVGLRKRGARSR